MPLRDDTARIQEQLGAFCRNGEAAGDIPGVTPGRISHYRRLVRNVVRDALDSAFPITHAALGEPGWDVLVPEFFTEGQPQSPQIWKLPYEFYLFHVERDSAERLGKPFLDDLLYFEWIEIEVHNMPDRPYPPFSTYGDLLSDRLVFNPEFEIIRLEYPVHLHPADATPALKGEFYILVFREPETGFVRFLNLSGLNAWLITKISDGERAAEELKGELARASGIESGRFLDETLSGFLTDLKDKGLILGFLKT